MVSAKAKARRREGPPVPTVRKSVADAAYEARAKAALRAILADGNISYEALAAKLRKRGMDISDGGLENKIARGTFSTAFLIQCLDALGIDQIAIPTE